MTLNTNGGKISVIVPVYNSERTLKTTIESIINQSYTNLEIILVNDGSTDKSLEICRYFENNDSRIIVINQSNQGVGEARNNGLNIASGEFVSFIDSDDIIDNNFFETLYDTACKTGADIIESGAKVILPGDNIIYPYEKSPKIIECDNKEYMKHYLDFSFNVSVWGKIYKKELIGDIRFPKLNINEDFIFLWEIVKRTNKFCENLNVNYHYFLNKEKSLSKSPFCHDNMSMLDHLEEVVQDVRELEPELLPEAMNHYSACLLHTLVLYYNYITSVDSYQSGEYYLEDRDRLLEATQNMTPITSYLLLHESEYDVSKLIDEIYNKTNKTRGKKI